MRKVCVVLCDRANLGRLAPVLDAIQAHPALELQVVCAGTMPLNRFGRALDLVSESGYRIDAEIYAELDGNTLGTMARSIGLHVSEFVSAFERLQPDIVAVIGDRYEAVAAALAAATMNLKLLHVQGGEQSRCVDNKYRHMITKAADFHWPATQKASDNLRRMGEPASAILGVGCPASDIAANIEVSDKPTGPILCIFHPTTDEPVSERKQMLEVLRALEGLPYHVRCWWPNADAGSDEIGKAIRIWMNEQRAQGKCLERFETVKNMPPKEYMQALANARCLCGNSSSFARDSSHFGTPCVLVGNRQNKRESGPNVLRVPCEREAIRSAVQKQVVHGRYPRRNLYGDGNVSAKIAEALATMELGSKKELVLQ